MVRILEGGNRISSADQVQYLHDKWRSQMLKGMLEFYILYSIKKRQPIHGYPILKDLKSSVPIAEDIADGPVYAVLNRLNKEGMIKFEYKVADGRRRKLYEMTELGEQFLNRVEADWEAIKKISYF